MYERIAFFFKDFSPYLTGIFASFFLFILFVFLNHPTYQKSKKYCSQLLFLLSAQFWYLVYLKLILDTFMTIQMVWVFYKLTKDGLKDMLFIIISLKEIGILKQKN